jgi:MFS family permease
MNTFAQLVGAAAPVLSGYFIDHIGYVPVFATGMVVALIGWAASLFLKEHRVV